MHVRRGKAPHAARLPQSRRLRRSHRLARRDRGGHRGARKKGAGAHRRAGTAAPPGAVARSPDGCRDREPRRAAKTTEGSGSGPEAGGAASEEPPEGGGLVPRSAPRRGSARGARLGLPRAAAGGRARSSEGSGGERRRRSLEPAIDRGVAATGGGEGAGARRDGGDRGLAPAANRRRPTRGSALAAVRSGERASGCGKGVQRRAPAEESSGGAAEDRRAATEGGRRHSATGPGDEPRARRSASRAALESRSR